jgi:hypothetical protein
VIAITVDLDNEFLAGPQEVDLEPGDANVRNRLRQLGLPAKLSHDALGLRAGKTSALDVQKRADRGRASAPRDALEGSGYVPLS